MITAIILARCDSSRLPKKHFLKIGDKSLLEITTENLLRNNLLKERIFTSIHWELDKEFNKKNFLFETTLSKEILTIPIDHRYNFYDMKVISIENDFPEQIRYNDFTFFKKYGVDEIYNNYLPDDLTSTYPSLCSVISEI